MSYDWYDGDNDDYISLITILFEVNTKIQRKKNNQPIAVRPA